MREKLSLKRVWCSNSNNRVAKEPPLSHLERSRESSRWLDRWVLQSRAGECVLQIDEAPGRSWWLWQVRSRGWKVERSNTNRIPRFVTQRGSRWTGEDRSERPGLKSGVSGDEAQVCALSGAQGDVAAEKVVKSTKPRPRKTNRCGKQTFKKRGKTPGM